MNGLEKRLVLQPILWTKEVSGSTGTAGRTYQGYDVSERYSAVPGELHASP